MTLQEFLDTTAQVPAPELRCAMVRALAAEPARTPDARRRFYARVADQLAVAAARSARPAQPRQPPAKLVGLEAQ